MRDGLVPQMERKVWIHAAPSCDEMVLAGADGSFRRIGPMLVGRDELEVKLLFTHVFFE